MEIFEPIKEIAKKGLDNSNTPYACERALRDILYYIDREDENWRLRKEYYKR